MVVVEKKSIFDGFGKYKNIKILYFFEFASLSCFQPFISIYLKSQGLSASVIGVITCLLPFIAFISCPIWTSLTDRYSVQKQTVIINCILSMVALLLLIPVGSHIAGIFLLIGFYSLVSAPIYPIVDSLVLKELGEDSKMYGEQRLFGAISYGLVAFLTGIIIEHANVYMIFVIYSFWMVIFVVFYIFNQTKYTSKFEISNKITGSFKKLVNENQLNIANDNSINDNDETTTDGSSTQTQQHKNIILSTDIVVEPIKEDQHSFGDDNNSNIILSNQNIDIIDNNDNKVSLLKGNNNDEETPSGDYDGANEFEEVSTINDDQTTGDDETKQTSKQVILNLLKNTQMMIFLFCIMVCGLTFNIISNFLFLFLKDHLDASNFLLGSIMPFTVVMELPFFFFGKQMLEKVGITKMIIIGHLAFFFRLCLYNIFTIESLTPWLILPIETFHGIAFATIWGAGVELSSLAAPKGWETTYQGIFNGVYSGLGSFIGSIIGGFIYEYKSPFFLWRFTAISIFLSCCIFTISQIYHTRKNKLNKNHSHF